MSVRNILDQLQTGTAEDFHYSETIHFVGAGAMASKCNMFRTGNLCYLSLDPASIPLTSQNQTINSYQLDLPEPMRPLTSKTTNIIANNGTSDFVGSLTLVKNTVVIPGILPYQLVISNGPLGGEGFAINATNVGIPYGAMIIYAAN